MFGAFNTFGKLGSPAGGRSLTLAQQIAAMLPSLWLEPSLTNYQDSAGTTLVTQPGGGAADPPVGKVLNLSGLGNHATQSTSTARPKLSARRNLLTYTEDFSNAAWAKSNVTVAANTVIAPDGTSTADTLTSVAAADNFVGTSVSNVNFVGAAWTFSFWAWTASGSALLPVLGDDGSGRFWSNPSINKASVTTTPTRFTYTGTAPASSAAIVRAGFGGYSAWTTATNIFIWGAQLELGSTATAYQSVTDANTYAYAGWPLIHQFDGVDDVLNVTFPSSLGSDCTVVTANRGTTPTIATGQTIGTSYTITATNAGRLVFPRALTAAETAIVTKWATQKGALPA
jgi:hypothetical protein